MSYISAFGVVPGLIIGGSYFILDNLCAFDYQVPFIKPQPFAMPDNTNVQLNNNDRRNKSCDCIFLMHNTTDRVASLRLAPTVSLTVYTKLFTQLFTAKFRILFHYSIIPLFQNLQNILM